MMDLAFGHHVRLASALTALALVVGAADARADSPVARGAAQALPPSSGVAVAQADEEASTRFKRGLQLFDEGDYALAIVEFERAYQLAPNYRALYNIGLVNVQLARYADATRIFEQYLRDGGADVPPARKAEVVKTLAELKLRTSTVDVSVNAAGAEVSLDGKPLDAGSFHAPTLIDAGEHTFRATASGFQPGYRTITLAGGDVASVRLQLVAIEPLRVDVPREPARSVFVPGFIATGVFAAGAIVSGSIMLAARSRLNSEQNTVGSSQAQRSSSASEVNTAAAVADVCTGLALVSGGVSLYLSLRLDRSARPSVGTAVPQGLALSGTF
jgi:Tfp pilus assembly protein PilF